MVSPTQVTNGAGSEPPAVIEIVLDYDPSTYAVSVTPCQVHKGDTICFTSPKGKVRVVFVSPFTEEETVMFDSEERKLTSSGAFPFRCFFKGTGEYAREIEATTGGVLDVQPHRP